MKIKFISNATDRQEARKAGRKAVSGLHIIDRDFNYANVIKKVNVDDAIAAMYIQQKEKAENDKPSTTIINTGQRV